MGLRTIRLVFAVALLAGCVSNNTHIVTPEEFSQTRGASMKAKQLSPGDEVVFSVEVNGKEEVPPSPIKLNFSGSIPAPLIGDVKLNNLTLAEARVALEKGYSRIFVAEPMITLRLANDKEAGEWGYVTVLGQVRSPGRFSVPSIAGMTLSDALHDAGGFGENANMHEIVVTRNVADGKQIQCKCDITKLGKAGSGHYDLVLSDGDIIYVPERLF